MGGVDDRSLPGNLAAKDGVDIAWLSFETRLAEWFRIAEWSVGDDREVQYSS